MARVCVRFDKCTGTSIADDDFCIFDISSDSGELQSSSTFKKLDVKEISRIDKPRSMSITDGPYWLWGMRCTRRLAGMTDAGQDTVIGCAHRDSYKSSLIPMYFPSFVSAQKATFKLTNCKHTIVVSAILEVLLVAKRGNKNTYL